MKASKIELSDDESVLEDKCKAIMDIIHASMQTIDDPEAWIQSLSVILVSYCKDKKSFEVVITLLQLYHEKYLEKMGKK